MALAMSEVRAIVQRVCARPEVLAACRQHDIGFVVEVLGKHKPKVTQGQIAALTGIAQGRLSEYMSHKRTPEKASIFRDFADGLDMPLVARRHSGFPRTGQPRPAAAWYPRCGNRPMNGPGIPGDPGRCRGERGQVVARRPRPTQPSWRAAGSTLADGTMPRCAGWSIQSACRPSPRTAYISACRTSHASARP